MRVVVCSVVGLLASRAYGLVAPLKMPPVRPKSGNALVVRAQETDLAEGFWKKRGAKNLLVAGGLVAVASGSVGLTVSALWGATQGAFATLASGGGVAIGERWWEQRQQHRNFLSKLRSQIPLDIDAKKLLRRPGLTSEIQDFVETGDLSNDFLVVSGQKKTGKTTAVKMALENRPGVVTVEISNSAKSLLDAVASELGIDASGPVQIARRIFEVQDISHPFVVIASIATSTDPRIVTNVGSDMKIFVEAARGKVGGIVEVSNSTSIFALDDFKPRVIHIVVVGLTEEEANDFFDKQGVLLDDEGRVLRQRIIENDSTIIGTLANYSNKYNKAPDDPAAKLAAVQAMYDDRANEADEHVEDLLKFGRGVEKGSEFDVSEMRKLVKRLLDAATPEDGVLKKGLVLPRAADVAPVLKKYPVLRHNPSTLRYYWYEPRHRRAAERLKQAKSSLLQS